MNEFENRLEAYRAAERKKELVNTCKNYLPTAFSKVTVYMSKDYEEVVSEVGLNILISVQRVHTHTHTHIHDTNFCTTGIRD